MQWIHCEVQSKELSRLAFKATMGKAEKQKREKGEELSRLAFKATMDQNKGQFRQISESQGHHESHDLYFYLLSIPLLCPVWPARHQTRTASRLRGLSHQAGRYQRPSLRENGGFWKRKPQTTYTTMLKDTWFPIIRIRSSESCPAIMNHDPSDPSLSLLIPTCHADNFKNTYDKILRRHQSDGKFGVKSLMKFGINVVKAYPKETELR
ncbi:hypothetical protein BC938DRAFT_482698 [Jimgerdemannia flammicorona]|uniref:Uncharacterized protein n=1 Tax=Jimgerdemannia flammicorona TaxID=994334 RepID=A0A433QDG9_9FUNG|nr:hypothetical protein BC938DRAFT_482698 [Jimgerdemannia flammicorona]